MVQSGIYGVTCDPCPPPHPVDNPLTRYLGADLLPNIKTDEQVAAFAREATLTRLHLRYTKDSAPDDLVFKVAAPVHGGVPDVKGAMAAQSNRFQGRYLMWTEGCGSAFGGMFSPGTTALSGASTTATKLVDPFEQVITSDIAELGVKAVPLAKDPRPLPEAPPVSRWQGLVGYGSGPGRTAALSLEAPEVSGKLDPELVRKVVHANRGQLRYCYEYALTNKPGLAGSVTLLFEIDARGVVTASSAGESTLQDAAVQSCVTGRVRTWMFPKPKDGKPVLVKQAVVFGQK
jgi:hypothetical protein